MTPRARQSDPPKAWSGKQRTPETVAFLANPKVEKWYDERALKSRLSADNDARKLRLTLERLGIGPAEVLDLAKKDPDELRARLVRYAADLKRKGRLAVYVAKTFSGLKSFLEYWHVEFTGYPKLDLIRGASIESERVPTPEELGGVLAGLSLRSRAVALLIAHAGLRPQTLGTYQAEAGLTLGDLPELVVTPEPRFEQIPFVVRVPANLSKTRKAYTTFGTRQAAHVLLAYLRERIQKGERLAKSSPMVARNDLRGVAKMLVDTARNRGEFVTTTNLITEVAKALHASAPKGVRWRPYVLRAYCSTRLLIAEGSGLISRDLREAILGHDTGVAGRYHVGKRWGEELLVEARKEYARASSFLETSVGEGRDATAEFKRALLAVAGVPENEQAKYLGTSNEELLGVLRDKLLKGNPEAERPSAQQRPFALADAELRLAEGWTFVANFGADRVLLSAPVGGGRA
jgi:hypothetical protein